MSTTTKEEQLRELLGTTLSVAQSCHSCSTDTYLFLGSFTREHHIPSAPACGACLERALDPFGLQYALLTANLLVYPFAPALQLSCHDDAEPNERFQAWNGESIIARPTLDALLDEILAAVRRRKQREERTQAGRSPTDDPPAAA